MIHLLLSISTPLSTLIFGGRIGFWLHKRRTPDYKSRWQEAVKSLERQEGFAPGGSLPAKPAYRDLCLPPVRPVPPPTYHLGVDFEPSKATGTMYGHVYAVHMNGKRKKLGSQVDPMSYEASWTAMKKAAKKQVDEMNAFLV